MDKNNLMQEKAGKCQVSPTLTILVPKGDKKIKIVYLLCLPGDYLDNMD